MIFSFLALITFCTIERTHGRVGTHPGIEEMNDGNRFTFPATETTQFVHGICVTGASSAHATSDFEGLTYTEVRPFVDGTLAWDDRSYTHTGIIFSPCAGGIFLRPSRHKSIDRGTVIDVTAISDGSSNTKICATIDRKTGRDGNWQNSLVKMGFIEYESRGFKWINEQRAFCKVLTKQKRCDELYILEDFTLETTTRPLQNAPLGTITIASYEYRGTYPINSGVYMISNIKYDSICTIVKSRGAPKCEVEVKIRFCKAIDCENTTMYGKFMASGTGPEPYVISGGTGDLFKAGGTVDSELRQSDLALTSVTINLCFNNRG